MRNSIFTAILLLVGCAAPQKELMSHLDIDFPKTEDLTQVAEYNGFEIFESYGNFVVKDSLLIVTDPGDDYFFRCFNLNTQQEVAKFVLKGKANTEMIQASGVELYGDSLNIISANHPSMIKTYHLNSLSDRDSRISTLNRPDSISSFDFIKISDTELFGAGQNYGQGELGVAKYFISNGNNVETIGEYDKNLFSANTTLDDNDIHWDVLAVKKPSGNKIATATENGFLLEVVDFKNKSIDSQRYYDKVCFEIKKTENMKMTAPVSKMKTSAIGCSEDHIMVVKEEETNNEQYYKKKRFSYELLIFDWKLNPVKKYKIPFDQTRQHISQDGKYLYILKPTDEGLYSLIKYQI